MKSRFPARAAFACLACVTVSAAAATCDDYGRWLADGCRRVVDTYEQGDTGVLVSGYAWHLPWTWTAEKRDSLNPRAWGGGIVRTVEDPDGGTHSVFALAFKDSHHHVQFNVGYEHSTYWGSRDFVQPGLGYTLMVVQRPDVLGGVPFPALLPLLSLRYRQATLMTTYIPTVNGGINNGSILYFFGRILLK
jgi:palmitoyl transferase